MFLTQLYVARQPTRHEFVRLLLSILLLCTVLGLSPFAVAELSERQVAEQVQQEHGGQILDIKHLKAHNRSAYRIKLLQPSGHVKLLLIDANTGRQLSNGHSSEPSEQSDQADQRP